MEDIPYEIKWKILEYIDRREFSNVFCVDRDFLRVSHEPNFWKDLYLNDLASNIEKQKMASIGGTLDYWKHLFLENFLGTNGFKLLLDKEANMDTSYDYIFKFVMSGDSMVGKTSLIRRFHDRTFNGNDYVSTIGVDFIIMKLIDLTREIEISEDNGKLKKKCKPKLKIQIWDQSGKFSF